MRQGASIFVVLVLLGLTLPGSGTASTPQGPLKISNDEIAAKAERYRYPDRGGQCLAFVAEMIKAAGGPRFRFGDVTSEYQKKWKQFGAVQIKSLAVARRGDIVQWGGGLGGTRDPHTAIITSTGKDPQVIDSNFAWPEDELVRRGSFGSRNPKGAKYRIWRMGKVAAPKPKPSPLKRYAGQIVQWSGDKKSQKTAWLVGSDLKRRWIPDIATYDCLKARGVRGPVKLPAKTLDKLKDLRGVRATCTPPPPPVVPPATTPVPEPKPPPKEPAPKPKPKPAPRTVTLSKGASAQGLSGCKSSYCRYMTVSFKNFSSGSHTITCRASNGSEAGFFTYTRSGSSGSSAVCYYGFPGHKVWVTVDGVSSNKITW